MLFEKIKLEPDEKILHIAHKHWFVFFVQALSILIIALAPLVAWFTVLFFAKQHMPNLVTEIQQYTPYLLYLYSFWLLICWMMLAHLWVTYYLDIWVVTNRRVIVINQKALFRRRIGSFRLERLQDLNIEINGILATLLRYGTIEAETAGENNENTFKTKYLPNPRELKAIILKAADDLMNEHMKIHNKRQQLQ